MTTAMKWIAASLIVVPVVLAATYFSFRSTTWDCGMKMTIGDMHREKNGFSMSGQRVKTFGVLLSSVSMSIGSPGGGNSGIGMQYRFGGDGNYRFRYSDNITRIRLRVEGKKVYDGPPIAEFNAGKGELGIEIQAEGKTFIEATNRCSLDSL